MGERRSPEELLTFPCLYEYKVFGVAEDHGFCEAVLAAVSRTVVVAGESATIRRSSGGRFQCVTVRVRLESGGQLAQIYESLRALEGVCFLL